MKNVIVTLITALCLLAVGIAYDSPQSPGDIGQLAEVNAHNRIVYSFPPITTANDKYIDRQWALSDIKAPEAWEITAGDTSVTIAVLDSGINGGHEDLTGKVIGEVNFSDSPVTADMNGHGTHIAGIIAATANNKLGIAGLAYNCRLLNVKVAGDNARVSVPALSKGIIWAADHGANVINMSLFTRSPSRDLEAAVNYAWNKGAILIAAAGNSKDDGRVYPASYEHCIAVAATDNDDSITTWSNNGDWVHIAAPGNHVISTVPFGYEYKSGTSMAAAYVSGTAALLFGTERNGTDSRMTNEQVRDAIQNNCNTLVNSNTGGLNVLKALTAARD